MNLPVGLIILIYLFFIVLYMCLRASIKEVFDFILFYGKTKRYKKDYKKKKSFFYRWSFIGAFDKELDCDYKGRLKIIFFVSNIKFLFYIFLLNYWLFFDESDPKIFNWFDVLVIISALFIFLFLLWFAIHSTDWENVTLFGILKSILMRRVSNNKNGLSNSNFKIDLPDKNKKD